MKKKNKLMLAMLLPLLAATPTSVRAQLMPSTPTSQMERLTRGVVALPGSSGQFVSWRLLGSDAANTTFDLLDGERVVARDLAVSNYNDAAGKASSQYRVVTKVDGVAADTSEVCTPWNDIYKHIQLDRPTGGSDYSYFPHDCSAADVDGDGEYELVVMWDPTNRKDNAHMGVTGQPILDCYEMDGRRLWRVELGGNIRAGSHYTQFLVYDFDGDGRAELICKTAPMSTDGQGKYVTEAADDEAIRNLNNKIYYRNSNGIIMRGAELLTVFDGTTGAALHTIWYNPNRAGGTGYVAAYPAKSFWGDDYANRSERYLACVAYLDGADKRPSAVMCRGYYTRSYLWAVDFDGSKLSTHWLHASVSPTEVEVTDAEGHVKKTTYRSNTSGIGNHYTAYGQGCHNLSVADVDGDGADEIMYGSAAIDNDGSLLYSTGLGHGDAQHLGDLIPDRPGLEYFMVHESSPYGLSVRDAATGEILIHFTGSGDTGRGMAADINADHHGHEFWSSDTYNVYNAEGNVISSERGQRPRYCFRIYWDGDALDELLDGVTINKGTNRLLNLDRYGASASYGTKANPDLQADLFGDWREEVILFSKEDSASINIFSTNTPTQLAVPTLMHDHQYRMSIAWQNTGYNQPPHLGYSLIDYVSPRFVVEEGSLKEQTVLLGEPMSDVVCRYVNCTSVTLYQTWLNGERIKSYLAPEGFSFTRNSATQTVTLSGTPTEAGDYAFILRSLGGPSGYASTDTLRLHVVSNATAIAGITENVKDSEESVFNLQGVRMRACDTPLPKGVYVSRGRKFVVK